MLDEFGLPSLPAAAAKFDQARTAFSERSEAILAGWIERRGNASTRRAESPNAWFKREAYRLLAHYIEHGWTRVFSYYVKLDKRPNRLIDEAVKNPFKLGLLAMISDEGEFSRSNRHVFGNQMLYAWLHDVPPDFLNAFLAISGGPNQVALKLKSGRAEPGFEHRFDDQRMP